MPKEPTTSNPPPHAPTSKTPQSPGNKLTGDVDGPGAAADTLDGPATASAPRAHRSGPDRLGRIVESKWFWIVFVILSVGLPLYRSMSKKPIALPPVLAQVPDFTLTNQDNKPMAWGDFRGSVLVVNFIFTECTMVCPQMTAQMAKLQSRLIRSYPAIRLISISVDPANDTPEVLKAYGEKYRAERRLWTFLTGPLDTIQSVVTEGFKMSRLEEKDPADTNLFAITHGENFVIVDQLGQIRAYKHARNTEEINEIIKTVALLANSRPEAQSPTEVIDAGSASASPLGR